MILLLLQMVRNYVRKTERQKWSEISMEQAISAVLDNQMGLDRASAEFGVPKSTLARYVKKKRGNPELKVDKKAGKFQCVFTEQQELELVTYVKNMEKRLFGLSMQDLRTLAYQLAERNKIVHNFNKNYAMAGQDWINGFLKRHPDISVRKPEATSGARAMGFNKVAVTQFQTLLKECIDKYKFTSEKIFNCDETGISVNPKGHSKVLATKGKRQVGALTSCERGETVTVELCFSASGAYMPPMLIFPRKRKQKEFELGLPPGGWAEVTDSGWITSETFVGWFRKFISFSKATKDAPVLLLFDGHSTHTRNLELIDMARDNGVILLCFPPHCSHRLQPLDVSLMKPISVYYEEEVRKWLRSNPGKVVTLFQISTLFGAAFMNAATMRTAVNGFRKAGIWPPDMSVFTEDDFLPSAPTDIPLVDNTAPNNIRATQENADEEEIGQTDDTDEPLGTNPRTPSPNRENVPILPQCSWMSDVAPSPELIGTNSKAPFKDGENISILPQCSGTQNVAPKSDVTAKFRSSFPTASPEFVLPIPKVQQDKKRVSRKKGKTTILTSSPYLEELKRAKEETKIKEAKKIERAKRKVDLQEESGVATKESAQKRSKVQMKRRLPEKKAAKPAKIIINPEAGAGDSEDDADCLYCQERYSVSREGWIACSSCWKWAHNSCADIDSDDDEAVFICELCVK